MVPPAMFIGGGGLGDTIDNGLRLRRDIATFEGAGIVALLRWRPIGLPPWRSGICNDRRASWTGTVTMSREQYRRRRVRHLEELRRAGHEPELVKAAGALGTAFGGLFDYVWCTRCGRRDIRMLPKRIRPLSTVRRCPGEPGEFP